MSEAVVAYEEKLGALSVVDVRAQVNLIQHIMKEVMKKDEHYGVIPGTGTKPTLLKSGAEKLCLTFRLDPQYEIEKQTDGAHLTITSKCTLFHIPSGQRYGSGMGSCSTKESKYAYRQASIKCPECGKSAVIKGKEEYGGGWICFKKKEGCGAKFKDGDQSIEGQPRGRVPNEDLADQYNTVLKMANKRSLVAAVLNATAASDIFTQDIEDMPQFSARVVEDADITQDIPGAGKNAARNGSSAPQASNPSSREPAPLPAEPAEAAFILADQVSSLTDRFNTKEPRALKEFLRIAKLESLEKLPSGDYDEALEWIDRNFKNFKAA
jgi:ribosomal protein L37AE/L43A